MNEKKLTLKDLQEQIKAMKLNQKEEVQKALAEELEKSFWKYDVNDVLLLKNNILKVVVTSKFKYTSKDKKSSKPMYMVKYVHLKDAHDFHVDEFEIEPYEGDYEEILLRAYLDIRYKYRLLEDCIILGNKYETDKHDRSK